MHSQWNGLVSIAIESIAYQWITNRRGSRQSTGPGKRPGVLGDVHYNDGQVVKSPGGAIMLSCVTGGAELEPTARIAHNAKT